MNTITNNSTPIAVFLVPTTDPNRAFSDTPLNLFIQTVRKTHVVVIRRMPTADIQGTLREVKNLSKEAIIINVLVCCAHATNTKIVFNENAADGVYRIENIAKEHFQDLDAGASIFLLCCNTSTLAEKITKLTDLPTYAPKGDSCSIKTVFLPSKQNHFDLLQYNLDLSVITQKYEREKQGTEPVKHTSLEAREFLPRLAENASAGNASASFILGVYLLRGLLVKKNVLQALRCFYEAATHGHVYAEKTLENTHPTSPELIGPTTYYLALLSLQKQTRADQIKGYEYLLQSTLELYPPAMRFLAAKAKENDPLALLCLGKISEINSHPIFLDYYLKAALHGEHQAYYCLLNAHSLSFFSFIRGRAALYAGYFLAHHNIFSTALCYFEKAAFLNTPGAKEAIAFAKTRPK